MGLDDFKRYPLLLGQSPIQKLERPTKHLGGATLWAKREDLNSPYAFGGNKTRKLEYLVADALAQGYDTLVSIGGVQSESHPPGRGLGRRGAAPSDRSPPLLHRGSPHAP